MPEEQDPDLSFWLEALEPAKPPGHDLLDTICTSMDNSTLKTGTTPPNMRYLMTGKTGTVGSVTSNSWAPKKSSSSQTSTRRRELSPGGNRRLF